MQTELRTHSIRRWIGLEIAHKHDEQEMHHKSTDANRIKNTKAIRHWIENRS